MALLHSNVGKVIIILLVMVLVFSLFAVILHNAPDFFPNLINTIKVAVAAVVASIVLGLAVSLRGKQELERPWENPQIRQEQQLDADDEENDCFM